MIPPGWFLCPRCPADDNEWPASAWNARLGCCQACAAPIIRQERDARGARIRTLCSGGCGRRIETLAHVPAPLCRQCRRKLGRRRERDQHGRYRRVTTNQSGGER